MTSKEQELLIKLQAMFKIEGQERLKELSSGLLALEKMEDTAKQREIVETIFREAHSLKGAARAVNLLDLEPICQTMESVFSMLKRGELEITSDMFDVLHGAVDTMSQIISNPAKVDNAPVLVKEQLLSLMEEKKLVFSQKPKDKVEIVDRNKPTVNSQESAALRIINKEETMSGEETVRISVAKLDALILLAEEMLSVKLSEIQRVEELKDFKALLENYHKERAKIGHVFKGLKKTLQKNTSLDERVAKANVEQMLDFFQNSTSHIKLLENQTKQLLRTAEQERNSFGRMIDSLLEETKRMLMQPFTSLVDAFPKMVRDISRAQGKTIEFLVLGSEVKVDKRILEEMKDPLVHILRNCIDHGIEKPEERALKGKPLRGKITLTITQYNNRVEIVIEDDGAGIDHKKVLAAAVEGGIIGAGVGEMLSPDQTLNLIFQSEVSTSPMITDLSGRGLGLAIVSEKITKMGGTISLGTKPSAGTTFKISLPLTLSTFRGILARAGEQMFILPTTNVKEVVRISREEVKTIENKATISLNGRTLAFARLVDVLNLPMGQHSDPGEKLLQTVVLHSTEKEIAFQVDEIIHEQEVLVKSLGRQLSKVRNIAGATVLRTGEVVPILDIHDLVMSAIKASFTVERDIHIDRFSKETKRVLVVEDSITSRMLLKNIIESAGYEVKTAVDGLDGLTTLKSEPFNLVISDVEMPRMNGFELTAKIRSEEKLAHIPLVLVTSLDSREHKERGVEAGANAYIIKSTFDQTGLLDVINRLI